MDLAKRVKHMTWRLPSWKAASKEKPKIENVIAVGWIKIFIRFCNLFHYERVSRFPQWQIKDTMTCFQCVGEAKSFSKPFIASRAYFSTLQALEAAKVMMAAIVLKDAVRYFPKWMEKSIRSEVGRRKRPATWTRDKLIAGNRTTTQICLSWSSLSRKLLLRCLCSNFVSSVRRFFRCHFHWPVHSFQAQKKKRKTTTKWIINFPLTVMCSRDICDS